MTINKEVSATEHTGTKYLLVEINELNSGKEYTARCLAQCSNNQNPRLVADAIALNWYEDDLNEHPYDRDSFWFEGSEIAVEVGRIHELPQEHYDVLRLYLSDLTPSQSAIAEVIKYKNPTTS